MPKQRSGSSKQDKPKSAKKEPKDAEAPAVPKKQDAKAAEPAPEKPVESDQPGLDEKTNKFKTSMADLIKFKSVVKEAAEEFLNSDDHDEFLDILAEASQPLFHQDVPAIIIKLGFEKSPEDRLRLSKLLNVLKESITPAQMAIGFRKVTNALDELVIDFPDCRSALKGFFDHAVSNGYLQSKDAEEIQREADALAEEKNIPAIKQKISAIVDELFGSYEIGDAILSMEELNKPHLHFELVKKLISKALDNTNSVRELASRFLANAPIKQEQVAKGFTILLQRVEDLYLDVPDILHLLSSFLARAVSDEVIPPAFLSLVDLAKGDMGFQVIEATQDLIAGKNLVDRMAGVWEANEKAPQVSKDLAADVVVEQSAEWPPKAAYVNLGKMVSNLSAALVEEKEKRIAAEKAVDALTRRVDYLYTLLASTIAASPTKPPCAEEKQSPQKPSPPQKQPSQPTQAEKQSPPSAQPEKPESSAPSDADKGKNKKKKK